MRADHDVTKYGPFLEGEFSWWLLGDDRARMLAQAIIDAGGVVWTPIERADDLGLTWLPPWKPRWVEGDDGLRDWRCDTRYEIRGRS